ncbi:MAG: nucleotide-diphospho-sugar transferase [Helicobacteraceae bacterium]|nr:nucleotide-diphospho-sugar transferase [Helicobacteraceae bacterium]
MQPLTVAVLFLVFNRLDTTKKVFEAIREAKPPKLYIASDGAREEKTGEKEQVESIRNYIMEHIDWECEIKLLFRDNNLGCKYAVSSAIDWFFVNEEMGIILEDDCLASQDFFTFCEKLLLKYKNDTRISMISGTSYLFNEIDSDEDYFFSKYMAIWGWATWKRAWNSYDAEMQDWNKVKMQNRLKSIFFWDKNIENIFSHYFDLGYEKKVDTWDFQWVYTCLINSGYSITPYKNLVSNIGVEGTRSSENSPFINMKIEHINNVGKLKHATPLIHNLEIDKILFDNVFYRFKKYSKIKIYIFQLYRKLLRK